MSLMRPDKTHGHQMGAEMRHGRQMSAGMRHDGQNGLPKLTI